MGRFEVCMRFDFVEQDDSVGFVSGFVTINWHAIGELVYLYRFMVEMTGTPRYSSQMPNWARCCFCPSAVAPA